MKAWIVTLILFSTLPTWAQEESHNKRDSILARLEQTDLIDFSIKLLNLGDSGKMDRSKRRLLFSVLPIAPSSVGNGAVTISAINAAFFIDKQSNISTVYFYPYTNFKGSYGMILTPNIWLDQNDWNGTGDFRLIKNVLHDYGLGTRTSTNSNSLVEYGQIRTYFTGHTRLKKFLYLGAGYNMDYFYNVKQTDYSPPSGTDFSNYKFGTGTTTTSSGLTLNILRDNRRNSINPSNGFYGALIYRVNTKSMGSTYSWTSLYADARRYFSFSNTRHKILAFHTLYWGTYGDVPYFNLPATFQDLNGRAGRGYSANRFRGSEMLYGEVEYRFDISSHGFFGMVVFANIQSYAEPVSKSFESAAGAGGVGFRLKFNRNSDTNVALDFALGKDGPKFYVNLGEYF